MTLPKTMKAAVNRVYGSPDVLEVTDLPLPRPKEHEVLVKVRYSSVNRTDCGFLTATPAVVRLFAGLTKPKYPILGCEYAGDVIAAGAAVTKFSVGDRVFGFRDDVFGFGGHAEYSTESEHSMMTTIPDNIDYRQAAVGLEGSHYALQDIRAAELKPQSKVLVNGGTGAIGSAAVQLLAARGMIVTATCPGAYLEKVKALGASQVIDYENTDFTQSDERYDCVFDAVGKSSFKQARRVLTEDGLYLSTELGPYGQNPFQALVPKFLRRQQVKFPIPKALVSDAIEIADLMAKGQFNPLVDRSYPLAEIADAYRYVLSGQKIGNVLIDMPHRDT